VASWYSDPLAATVEIASRPIIEKHMI
jgi:hypothetical protein